MRILQQSPDKQSFLPASLKRIAGVALVGATALLAACQPVTLSGPGFSSNNNFNNTVNVAEPTGEVLGTGSVRVALLAPIGAEGVFGQTGTALRNAAAMALQDYSSADLQVIVKDVGRGPGAASQQAGRALQEGAQLVIGPLRSSAVKQAGQVLKPAGVPMIAFTTDTGAAARGVYLINFTPENDVERILSYASSRNKRSIAAILPSTPYGNVVEAALRQYAAHFGIRIVTIEKYKSGNSPDPFGLQTAAEQIGQVKNQIDSVFIPEAAAAAPAAQLLAGQGIRSGDVMFLGSSQWDNPSTFKEPMLRSAVYPAPPRSLRNLDGRTIGFDTFASRYASQFGQQPPRVASLAYDSVILAAALVAQAGERRFAHETLTDPQGFIGFGDGYFRFRADGTSQRSLAVMEISKGSARIIDDAPMSASGLPR
ncbi:ABC-type branched-chain amino acid transport system, substrate-binding protein [Cohaesibacter sp. ES.047]|uniref:penicillin-binding protein activator n=1 Tax=Cohaesibacter sp. ES.047 TaxID=1798205 RepID=UPI000BB8CE75|nr:penicillin-binding protein activator [Cohaesibacter sp. ES.047]SNY90467.1 ABC-type branched-chain amino acid transport system, substrate-binding protein [Cohaesibacter sp. ES.047]